MKYKVIGFTNTEYHPKFLDKDLDVAVALKEEFGLPFSLEDIFLIWRSYCHKVDLSGYPIETLKYNVEDAFGVILAPLGYKDKDNE